MNTLLLEHFAAVSKIAAYRQAREHQEGVNVSEGYLSVASDMGMTGDNLSVVSAFRAPEPNGKAQYVTTLIRDNHCYSLWMETQGHFYCGTGGGSQSLHLGDLAAGTDHLVALCRDGGTLYCYLDGELKGTLGVYDFVAADGFFVGRAAINQDTLFTSTIYSARVFDYTLSAEEVAALYNNGDPAGYVLPIPYKYKVANYISDFSKNTDGWSTVANYPGTSLNSGDGILSIYGDSTTLAIQKQDLSSGDKPSIFRIRIVFVEPFQGSRIRFFAHSFNDYADLTLSSEKLNAEGVVHIKKASNTVPNSFMYSYDVPIGDVVKISTITIESVGCVAEYLPQNLVESPHGDPIEIIGKNSYTWTGVDDSTYAKTIKFSQKLSEGRFYRFTITVSNYESGAPFFVANRGVNTYIPAQNGTYIIGVIIDRSYDSLMYIYGGNAGTDRRLTLIVNSIEAVSDVALSWLDSSKNLPLNDEYLPPLLQSDGGYDLTASGAPQIIIK